MRSHHQGVLKRAAGCACVLLGIASAPALPWPRDPQPLLPAPGVPVYAFEQDVPVSFYPDRDSQLSLNHRWYRGHGDTSLRWDWEQRGSSFDIRCSHAFPAEPDVTRPGRGTGIPRLTCERQPVFATWVYSEQPWGGMLRIEIRAGDEVLRQFFIALNFSGWKELRIPYHSGLPETADTVRILAPESIRSGTLYFDLLSPWCDVLTWREQARRDRLWPTPSSPDLWPR